MNANVRDLLLGAALAALLLGLGRNGGTLPAHHASILPLGSTATHSSVGPKSN